MNGAAIGPVVQGILALAREAGADRVADRLDTELRTPRPAGTLLVAVGGAGAGTSSVVAALVDRPGWLEGDVGTPSCGYLVVRYGPAGATVHRGDGSAPVAVALDEVAAAVRGQHPQVGPDVRAIDVTLPSPLLADGTTLVDVPGVGGALVSRDRDTADLLARADAVLYVAGAATPLTGEELDVLAGVGERVATVVVALNRVDQFHGWRQVRDDSEQLLRATVPALASAPVVPVSAALAAAAADLRGGPEDTATLADELEVESGIPTLLGILQADVLDRGRRLRVDNLVRLCDHAIAEAGRVFEARLAVPDDAALAQQEARARLEVLRTAAGQAGARTSERFVRLREQVQRDLAAGLRAASEGAEQALAAGARDGEEVLTRLVEDLRRVDRTVERTVGNAVAELVAEVADLLGEPIDVTELAPVASRLGEFDPAGIEVAVGAEPSHGMGLSMTSMLVSSSTSVGILSQRLATGGVDVLALLVGSGVALGAARLVASVRTSRRQRTARTTRARVRAALEQVRADEPGALRDRIGELQREVEQAVRAAVHGRHDELNRQYEAVEALATASRAEREQAAALARDRLAELGRLGGALAPLRQEQDA